jgi:sterol O-acyltransferase
MVMKMHSYITVNGQLQTVSTHAEKLMRDLRKATESVGGWEKAIVVAQARLAEIDAQSLSGVSTPPNGSINSSTHEPTPIGTPPVPEGSSTSYVDVKTANALRKRLTAVAAQNNNKNTERVNVRAIHKTQSKESLEPSETKFIVEEDLPEGLVPHPLVAHPDSQISAMASDISELQSELVSRGPTYVKWPETITWKNFAVYQLIPTLVYELEYPRTDRYEIFAASS